MRGGEPEYPPNDAGWNAAGHWNPLEGVVDALKEEATWHRYQHAHAHVQQATCAGELAIDTAPAAYA